MHNNEKNKVFLNELIDGIEKELTPESSEIILLLHKCHMLIMDIESFKEEMLDEIFKIESNSRSHSTIDVKLAAKRLEHITRKSFMLTEANQNVENNPLYANISQEAKDTFNDMVKNTEYSTYIEMVLILNGMLDSDPFYFRKDE